MVLPYINMNLPQVYTYSPSWTLLPPRTIPLGCPSAPAPSIQYHPSNLDWWLISYMILYMFQWSSNPSLCVNPRGTGWGGRREGGSEGGAYIYLWLIHADIWQKPTQYCYTNKAIILQSKIKWAIPNTRTHTQRMTCRFLTEWLCTWHVIDWELGEGPYLEVEMLTFPMNMASLRWLWIPQVENSPHIISCPGLKGAV